MLEGNDSRHGGVPYRHKTLLNRERGFVHLGPFDVVSLDGVFLDLAIEWAPTLRAGKALCKKLTCVRPKEPCQHGIFGWALIAKTRAGVHVVGSLNVLLPLKTAQKPLHQTEIVEHLVYVQDPLHHLMILLCEGLTGDNVSSLVRSDSMFHHVGRIGHGTVREQLCLEALYVLEAVEKELQVLLPGGEGRAGEPEHQLNAGR